MNLHTEHTLLVLIFHPHSITIVQRPRNWHVLY